MRQHVDSNQPTGFWAQARCSAADERGSLEATAYLLLILIVGCGVLCGVATIRDQFSQGYGDVADAVLSFDQSYTVTMTFAQLNGPPVPVQYGFVGTPGVTQTAGTGPGDMELGGPASSEN
jgi:hypothetical protein